MVAVTISREHGAFGTEIGRQVAERLGGPYLDRELIDMAFRFTGLPVPDPAAQAPRTIDRREVSGLARRIAEAIGGPLSSGLEAWPRYSPPRPQAVGEEDSLLRQVVDSDDDYVLVMSQVLERVVQEHPNAVLVGRGGQCILAGRPGVVHVHICAALSDRIDRVAEAEGLGRQEAANSVTAQDAARARYIRRYHGVDWQKPALYHLTVNTSWFSVDQAVELIMEAVRMVEGQG